MATIDLDDHNVIDLTVAEVREILGKLDEPLDLISELDKGQTSVKDEAYNDEYLVVIRITR